MLNLTNDLKYIGASDITINEHFTIHIPTLREIADYGEAKYWSLIQTLTATPYDYLLELHEMGVDYEEWTDMMIFGLVSHSLPAKDLSIIFGENFSFRDYVLTPDETDGTLKMIHEESGAVIDNIIYEYIVSTLRDIHGLKRNWKIAGNKFTKNFYVEDAKRKRELNKNKTFQSIIAPCIGGMVNCADFKYNYQTVMDLTIYEFLDAVKHLQHLKNYDNLMLGVYTGNIDPKEYSNKADFNWLVPPDRNTDDGGGE